LCSISARENDRLGSQTTVFSGLYMTFTSPKLNA
jgi:hypothetical protein